MLCAVLSARAGQPAAAAAAARLLQAAGGAAAPAAPAQQRGAHSSAVVPLDHPAVCVWGANTGVGKTLVSAGLVAAAVRRQVAVQYIKPVQTGFPQDSDARLVAAAAAHAAGGEAAAAAHLRCSETLFAYERPVSPHLAAAGEGRVAADAEVVGAVARRLREFAAEAPRPAAAAAAAGSRGPRGGGGALSVVETAGGVASPAPSGTLQGDLLRPLALPALLVGDHRLGGISTTLTAYESLLLRGQAPVAIALMADGWLGNAEAVARSLEHAAAHRLGQELPVLALPLCQPPPPPGASSSAAAAAAVDPELAAWLEASRPQFDELLELLQSHHAWRLDWLATAPERAAAGVWWPFTQHAQLPSVDVTVVEARAGEDWLVYRPPGGHHHHHHQQQQQQQRAGSSSSSSSGGGAGPRLEPLYDAAGSWWTQTADSAALQLEVARAVAGAAGRYMHVMWPQVAHAPGLELTEALLRGPLGAGWAGRAFFSDDGSTAVEVALKMALRKFLVDHGLHAPGAAQQQQQHTGQQQQHTEQQQQQQQQPELQLGGPGGLQLEVVALRNSYHGDTLGAMDCAARSPFNGPLQTPWYSGRGLFLDPPYLQLRGGRWRLRAPAWLPEGGAGGEAGGRGSGWTWGTREEAFGLQERTSSPLWARYLQHVDAAVAAHEASPAPGGGRRRLAALLLEPVLQGAGGMLLADPLFQRAAVQVARSRRLPVVYDEVFSGCWRLGVPAAGRLLGAAPDVACYAKLLTGGAAPLAVTLASEDVFRAFDGPSKAEALLHGHSYTAYPLGCAAAMASLQLLTRPGANPNLCTPEAPGRCAAAEAGGAPCDGPCGRLLPQWDERAAAELSRHPRVAGVVAIGSVLAVELSQQQQQQGQGQQGQQQGQGAASYGSSAAADVVAALRRRGVAARPLGPVVYLMVPPTAGGDTCAWLLAQLREVLDMQDGWGASGGDWVLI